MSLKSDIEHEIIVTTKGIPPDTYNWITDIVGGSGPGVAARPEFAKQMYQHGYTDGLRWVLRHESPSRHLLRVPEKCGFWLGRLLYLGLMWWFIHYPWGLLAVLGMLAGEMTEMKYKTWKEKNK